MLPLLRKSPAGRIVNVSSGLGSLTLSSDPSSPGYNTKFRNIGYSASKAALNMLTVHLAYELQNTKIKVNSANPGFTKTDLNDNTGTQPVEVEPSQPPAWRCSMTMAQLGSRSQRITSHLGRPK